MLLPSSLLQELRGPMLAGSMALGALAGAGCSTPTAAAEIAPEPAMEPIQVTEVAANDPVSYDANAENERLARVDQALAANENRRGQRIEDEQATHSVSTIATPIGLGHADAIGWASPGGYAHPACGRG